jgi:hypothetical protein
MTDHRSPTDPRPDPRFPRRPDHPDFRLLSMAVVGVDRAAASGQSFDDITGAVVDVESVTYIAEQRAIRALGPRYPGDRTFVLTSSVWIDGFYAGTRYQHLKTIGVHDCTPTDGLDDVEFRVHLRRELHLEEGASDPEILALVSTAYHFYLNNRPAEIARPIEALDIGQADPQ